MPKLYIEHDPERLTISRDRAARPLLIQNAETNKRPFIHPIMAPDGADEITENAPGHHIWQHGLYTGLNKINGYGFWTEGLNNDPLDGTFHPEPLSPAAIMENRAAWKVETSYRAPGGGLLLNETQGWTLEDRETTLVMDVHWTLRAATDLEFGKYSYGGLTLCMPWRPETLGEVLSSEGAVGHEAAEAQRARWVAISMAIPGRKIGPVGFAFFEHPSNPVFPTPWRVDGNLRLAPSRSIIGSWRLAEAESTSNRYRLIAFTGPINRGFIETQWNEFVVA